MCSPLDLPGCHLKFTAKLMSMRETTSSILYQWEKNGGLSYIKGFVQTGNFFKMGFSLLLQANS